MKKINFLFGIHCHQPIGNLPHVLEECYRTSYLPFINVMEKHPKIKFTFHYSGILYEWFVENHPDFMDKLRALVERGQAEAMTGGFYEPILALIPDRDKLGQINMQSEFIKKEFKAVPRGLWLPERIWEPHLARFLSEASVEYVTLDDYHFISAGIGENDMFGYYLTEEQGHKVAAFPISKELRYLIPFRPPNDLIGYLKWIATEEGNRAATIIDDGEKFGVWPGTHKWVYEDGYLENLLKTLEDNSSWVIPMTFSEYLDAFPPISKIYLPTASYFEMMEWALPTEAAIKFNNILTELRGMGKEKEYLRFFKGGFFRNFLVKYSESNNMYSKMLHLSGNISTLREGSGLKADPERENKLKAAELELWKGQCNCAYWHGIFGGLYLNFLRDAIYEHLIRGEVILDKIKHRGKFVELSITDFDKDGNEEIIISNDLLSLYISPIYGGSLFELDYKPKCFNLLNTLTRREEFYHKKISVADAAGGEDGLSGIVSIHNLNKIEARKLEGFLSYDRWRRVSILDHFIPENTILEAFKNGKHTELGDFAGSQYKVFVKRSQNEANLTLSRVGDVECAGEKNKVKVSKSISLFAGQSIVTLSYEVQNQSGSVLDLNFGVEFNLSVVNRSLMNQGITEDVSSVEIIDEARGVSVSLDTQKPCGLWRFPVETISQSESGFERKYQETAIFQNWKLKLDPGEVWSNKIVLKIEES
ncbi:MAG: DUF1926 domain-containing protein [Candidatus Saganbacteria bacterium]|nr:DUF1926 domain-containing protein [Candidatus Saganbacteria bacterium]